MKTPRIFGPDDPDYPTSPALRARLAQEGRLASPPNGAGSRPQMMAVCAAPPPPEINPAEKALIKRLHGVMSAAKLLELLNERRAADRESNTLRLTAEQLQAEITTVADLPSVSAGTDWAGLRKLLAEARRSGVLDAIDEQVLNDFAVVFSCSPKQLVSLKEIVLGAKEDRS